MSAVSLFEMSNTVTELQARKGQAGRQMNAMRNDRASGGNIRQRRANRLLFVTDYRECGKIRRSKSRIL